jgi:hypothetical protein
MTDERIDGPALQRGNERRVWEKPAFHDMRAGIAEFGGDTSVDGSASLS